MKSVSQASRLPVYYHADKLTAVPEVLITVF